MPLGLGTGLSKSGIVTPGIITDNLVLKHKYDAGAVVPVSDGAAFFNGSSEYVTMGDVTSFDGADDLTISLWVMRTDDDTASLVDKGGYWDSNSSFGLRYDPTGNGGRLAFSVGSSSAGAYEHWDNNNTNFPKNKWTHIAIVYSNTDDTIDGYINGVNLGAGGASGTLISIPNEAKNLVFGRTDGGAFWLGGYMCNVGMWTGKLTQPQVKSIMNKNYAGLTDSEKTNLVSWWNLDKTIGQTIDSSINTNNSNNPTASYNYSDKLVFDNNGSFNTTVLEETLSADVESDGGGTSGGWSLGVNIRAVGDVTTVTKNGRRAVKIQNGSEDDSESQNSMYKTVACTVGKVYKFSCYMMTDTPMTTPTKSLRMGAYDSGEDPDGQYSAYTNATDWEYASVYMRADTTSINFYLRSANDTGTGISNITYFSGMKVEESSGNDGELI